MSEGIEEEGGGVNGLTLKKRIPLCGTGCQAIYSIFTTKLIFLN